ncbi:hypothetical protein Dimus_032740 [Dionaea muscipula]
METSPKSPTSPSSSSSSGSGGGGGTTTSHQNSLHNHSRLQNHHPPPPTPPPQATPKHQQQQSYPQTPPTIGRPESNPYPTTFVQADTSSFKQVVQMLTGSSETAKLACQPRPRPRPMSSSSTTTTTTITNNPPDQHPRNPIPPIKASTKTKPSRLYERRNSLLLPGLTSNSNGGGFLSPHRNNNNNPEMKILSPSLLDFPSLVLSPVTPLIPDPFNRSGWVVVDRAAEEKAIAEKGFYLHPSPVSTPRDSEPRLLPLFPTTSPRVAGSDSYHNHS